LIGIRFLAVLLAFLLLGTLAAAALGLLNAVPLQLFYALAAAGLAALLGTAPALAHRQFRRRVAPSEPRDSLAALGASAALVFAGLGAFALVASRVNEGYVDEVWPLFYPGLPLFAALAGLAREGYLATLRWLGADEEPPRRPGRNRDHG
jgi:MFS family permease